MRRKHKSAVERIALYKVARELVRRGNLVGCSTLNFVAITLNPSLSPVFNPAHYSFYASHPKTENRFGAFWSFGFFHLSTKTVKQVLQPVLTSIVQPSSRLPTGLHGARLTGNLSVRLLWHVGFWLGCKWPAGITKCCLQQCFQCPCCAAVFSAHHVSSVLKVAFMAGSETSRIKGWSMEPR